MRIGLISDSHGSREAVDRAVKAMGKIDLLVHLGDGADNDLVDCPLVRIWKVKGNCDYDGDLLKELVEPLDSGIRGLFCHGDRWGVKMGMDRLVYHAMEQDVHLACFGHTHRSCIEYAGRILLVNPGSCRGMGASCAVIEIKRDGTMHPQIISL